MGLSCIGSVLPVSVAPFLSNQDWKRCWIVSILFQKFKSYQLLLFCASRSKAIIHTEQKLSTIYKSIVCVWRMLGFLSSVNDTFYCSRVIVVIVTDDCHQQYSINRWIWQLLEDEHASVLIHASLLEHASLLLLMIGFILRRFSPASVGSTLFV